MKSGESCSWDDEHRNHAGKPLDISKPRPCFQIVARYSTFERIGVVELGMRCENERELLVELQK